MWWRSDRIQWIGHDVSSVAYADSQRKKVFHTVATCLSQPADSVGPFRAHLSLPCLGFHPAASRNQDRTRKP